MTTCNRKIQRETYDHVYQQGRNRSVIVSIEPPGLIGFRLKGTRTCYRLPADALYWFALKADLAARKREAAKQRRKVHR